jgi:putative serine protease PepD
VKVGQVFPGAAADQSGIQTGDLIVAMDGEKIDGLVDYSTFLRAHAPGDRVRITLVRAGATLQLEAALQERR